MGNNRVDAPLKIVDDLLHAAADAAEFHEHGAEDQHLNEQRYGGDDNEKRQHPVWHVAPPTFPSIFRADTLRGRRPQRRRWILSVSRRPAFRVRQDPRPFRATRELYAERTPCLLRRAGSGTRGFRRRIWERKECPQGRRSRGLP